MKANVTKRDRRKPRVKDLTSKDAAKVKGGAAADLSLAKACATGTHIKEGTLTT
jgi:hypothetical protein